MKWYDNNSGSNDVFAAARIRLNRNIEGCKFPEKLEKEEQKALTALLADRIEGISDGKGDPFRYYSLKECTEQERRAFRERRVINETAATGKHEAGLFLSQDESTGITLNSDDHIRIHAFGTALNLNRLYGICDHIDDQINEKFSYAFDSKYGYLTTYPTSMGTGLKVSAILHMPCLSEGKAFRGLLAEVGRMGIQVKGLFGDGAENFGSFYEVNNQKTLGQSEEEILSLVFRMASHLAVNERKARSMAIRENRVLLEDQAFKAYGILSYARQLSEGEAINCLSHIRVGLCEGLIRMEKPVSIFGLIWECRDATIRERRIGELSQTECNAARAEMIRSRLPRLILPE